MTYPLDDMTCVVGSLDGQNIIMGADSAAVSDRHEVYTIPEPKVFACGSYLIGVCGSYRVGQVLQHRQRDLPEPPSTTALRSFLIGELAPAIGGLVRAEGVSSGRMYLGDQVALMLGVSGQLWQICSDLTVIPADTFSAIGCGRHLAYGALNALHEVSFEPVQRRLELVLETVAKYNPAVRPPWHFVRSDHECNAARVACLSSKSG